MTVNLFNLLFLTFSLEFATSSSCNIHTSCSDIGEESIENIALPTGYRRVPLDSGSFGFWIRKIKLKPDKTVYLFNGRRKANQDAQYAVLDMPVGTKDLQQCADAVMRLYAEWRYSKKEFGKIVFSDNNGKQYPCPINADRKGFEGYLERVFMFCGTASLQKQLKPVGNFELIEPGQVLIRGGSPGHCVMVVDVAVNSRGKKIYLLAQSYMPAQDIHVLKNPSAGISPWYEVSETMASIVTPSGPSLKMSSGPGPSGALRITINQCDM